MPTRSRPNQMTLDLGIYKAPWLEWCAANGVKPGQAFRQIIAKLTASSASSESGRKVHRQREMPTRQMELHFTPSEHAQVTALAGEQGFSPTKWVVALVRAHLTKQSQFGQSELERLAQSNQQLLALGRNLNQIAKALNSSPQHAGSVPVELLTALRTTIHTHTQTVSMIMRANVERWSIR